MGIQVRRLAVLSPGRAGRSLLGKVVAVIGSLVLAVAAAGPALGKPAGKPDPVHLVVHAWAGDNGDDFLGLTEVIDDYDKKNKDVTIEILFDLGQVAHFYEIEARLEEGTAWADIVIGELRTMTETALVRPDRWVDLSTLLPAGTDQSYTPYRWSASVTHDGRQLGLPIDAPSVAMCYRKDLFQAAGLPSDRASVAALWPTWNDFIDVGVRYKNATGLALMESSWTPFDAVATQHGGPIFYDSSNTLVVESSAAIATAWNLSVQMAQSGITAAAPQWTDDWFAGMSNGRFAAMICPSWILGLIPANAPGLAGAWDVAALPGGASYRGGAWMSIPATSQHQLEAAELAANLGAKKAALAMSQAATNTEPGGGLLVPANLEAADSQQIRNATHPYYANAPIGQLYTAYVHAPDTVYLGPRYGTLRNILEAALRNVEAGQSTPEDAWAYAIAQINAIAS